jgi:hypothetical protein
MHIKGTLRLDWDLDPAHDAHDREINRFADGIQRRLEPPADLRRERGHGPSAENQF